MSMYYNKYCQLLIKKIFLVIIEMKIIFRIHKLVKYITQAKTIYRFFDYFDVAADVV